MTLFMNNPDEYEGGEFDLEYSHPESTPRYKTFKLNDVIKAHKLMESSKHIGKIILLN